MLNFMPHALFKDSERKITLSKEVNNDWLKEFTSITSLLFKLLSDLLLSGATVCVRHTYVSLYRFNTTVYRKVQ